jgi:hypothetical protein
VGQAVGELAVIGQQDKTAAVRIQPSDRIQAQAGCGHEGDHGGSAVRVARARNDAHGLVQRKEHPRLGAFDGAAVNRHAAAHADVASGIVDDVAFHAHAPGRDHRLGRAPRGHPCVGEVLR